MNYCTQWIDEQGQTQELTDDKRKFIVDDIVVQTFAKRAFRTIMLAYGDISKQDYETLKSANNNFKSESDREVLENNLTIIGIYALQDPLRDEIVDSVHKCKNAGINIRMVTGDNLDTAKAIAIEAGIVSREEADNKYVCMEGKEFRELCGGLKQLNDPNDPNLVKEAVADMRNFNIIQ